MLKNLTLRFIKGALYGLVGNAGAMLAQGAATYQPTGDAVTVYLWQGLAVGAFTGLASALKRWATWDQAKAGR